ncbi:aminotransferase class I/II-fold pyridoxal phosphate-dependent enzyme [Bdellovibrio bacteriovorus]|uniref:Cys/Met metabolism lyase (PLP-dependent) n=1 Tax=Bdellovibrio bacteriovorus (strain ATCC 15356 / DSM 50701 / NCIMB 9529 / HD100) TaxID=264462 RepID=Q6MN74_BDEBA|nr:aminotransferase class I/II-fold pyridoxal phosphate-dependent enzyme [Bdellovibrio bacteriovorus]AHZ86590.1 Cys/Met metabolism lyase [Bdellovibrio bacteriovorus]BEV67837.1 L-methionine gamma-lyase [Bdellovibrio bacteriovorus]CAE79278.1 Cys/Met metabolism lyase (PLP-dependent) [Bdellovibrio bacteriovorus HD100]
MTKKKAAKSKSPRTQAIHGEFLSKSWEFSHHLIPPMTASTTFRLESLQRGAEGFSTFGAQKGEEKPIWIYDRLEEPTTKMLEDQLALLEKGECAVTFGSGMGAIASTLMSLLSSGQKVIAHKTLYGCTYSLLTNWLPRLNISTHLMDVNDFKNLELQLADPAARVVYFESVSNPILEIADLQKITALVKAANKKRGKDNQIYTVVDNTFATPWALRPVEWNVDFVIQSLTKNISGFGTEMGGAVIAPRTHESILRVARKDFGAIIHPYSAWHILVYGISTQAIRFEQQQASAWAVAKFLEAHPKVASVTYPGLKSHAQHKLAKKYLKSPEGKFAPGTMISFQLKGDMKKCQKFVDDIAKNSYSITLAVSLGLTKTLIEVPGFMTHSAIPDDKRGDSGIDPRAIRLSIGLENVNDIIEDLKEALKKI